MAKSRIAILLLVLMSCAMLFFTAGVCEEDGAMERMTVENDALRMELDASEGLQVTSLFLKTADKECLLRPSPLFSSRVTNRLRIGGYKLLDESDSRSMTVMEKKQEDVLGELGITRD